MLRGTSARIGTAFALAWLLSGCGALTPNAPTPIATSTPAPAPSANTIGLTVRVLMQGSERPLADATVLRNDAFVGRTDGDGMARTEVPVGVEFHIDVRAAGYVGFGASATVRTEERWTFYLEREPS